MLQAKSSIDKIRQRFPKGSIKNSIKQSQELQKILTLPFSYDTKELFNIHDVVYFLSTGFEIEEIFPLIIQLFSPQEINELILALSKITLNEKTSLVTELEHHELRSLITKESEEANVLGFINPQILDIVKKLIDIPERSIQRLYENQDFCLSIQKTIFMVISTLVPQKLNQIPALIKHNCIQRFASLEEEKELPELLLQYIILRTLRPLIEMLINDARKSLIVQAQVSLSLDSRKFENQLKQVFEELFFRPLSGYLSLETKPVKVDSFVQERQAFDQALAELAPPERVNADMHAFAKALIAEGDGFKFDGVKKTLHREMIEKCKPDKSISKLLQVQQPLPESERKLSFKDRVAQKPKAKKKSSESKFTDLTKDSNKKLIKKFKETIKIPFVNSSERSLENLALELIGINNATDIYAMIGETLDPSELNQLIQALNRIEAGKLLSDKGNFKRSNSLVTKLEKFEFDRVDSAWIDSLVLNPLVQAFSKCFEQDPNVTFETFQENDLHKKALNRIFIEFILELLRLPMEQIPAIIRNNCYHQYNIFNDVLKNDQATLIYIGGYVFLRYICPYLVVKIQELIQNDELRKIFINTMIKPLQTLTNHAEDSQAVKSSQKLGSWYAELFNSLKDLELESQFHQFLFAICESGFMLTPFQEKQLPIQQSPVSTAPKAAFLQPSPLQSPQPTADPNQVIYSLFPSGPS